MAPSLAKRHALLLDPRVSVTHLIRMSHGWGWIGRLALLGFLGLGSASAHAAAVCPSISVPPVQLPHLRAALQAAEPVIIVALGSSSTQGWMASDRAHSYPAILQSTLSAALPQDHVAVINRGIGGQDAPEEAARLQADVLAIRPQLVIWQVGANGALHSEDPATFERLVTDGVTRLHEAGADVILMDNQRSPRIMAAPEHEVMDRALADVAKISRASLFSRSHLMDAWQSAGWPYARFISADGLHQNDLGYRCVAQALADAIVDAVGRHSADAQVADVSKVPARRIATAR